jgi:hypothetical protein
MQATLQASPPPASASTASGIHATLQASPPPASASTASGIHATLQASPHRPPGARRSRARRQRSITRRAASSMQRLDARALRRATCQRANGVSATPYERYAAMQTDARRARRRRRTVGARCMLHTIYRYVACHDAWSMIQCEVARLKLHVASYVLQCRMPHHGTPLRCGACCTFHAGCCTSWCKLPTALVPQPHATRRSAVPH